MDVGSLYPYMTSHPYRDSNDATTKVRKLLSLIVAVAVSAVALWGVAAWMRTKSNGETNRREDPLLAASRKAGAEAVPDLVVAFTTMRVKSKPVPLPQRILLKFIDASATP